MHGQFSLERSSRSVWKQSLHEKLQGIQLLVIHLHSESVRNRLWWWWWSGMHLSKRLAVHSLNVVVFVHSDEGRTIVLSVPVHDSPFKLKVKEGQNCASHIAKSSVSHLSLTRSVVPASQQHGWMTVIQWPETRSIRSVERIEEELSLVPHSGMLH